MLLALRSLFVGFLLTACITTQPAPKSPMAKASSPARRVPASAALPLPPGTQGAARPSEVCYCGWANDPLGLPRLCAVWQRQWPRRERQPVVAFQTASSCRVQDCRLFFQGRTTCLAFEAWAAAPSQPTAEVAQNSHEPCYCDYAPVDGDPRGIEACAIWKASDKYLREYYFTPTCDFDVCRGRPFLTTALQCKDGLSKFY